MCGIAGVIAFRGWTSGERLASIVDAMTGRLRHRGPDDSGRWLDPCAPVAVGHSRLSIIDLSPQGHQPMLSTSGRYVLVFNGEIYNHQALRKELRETQFRGTSDTEVMLGAFEEWGVEGAVQRFNGMFAFALWDRKQRNIHLSCDRLGEKPLHYGCSGHLFGFASELKAFSEIPGFDREIDRDAVAAFLRYAYIPAPHSIFQSIRKIEPGTILTIPSDDLPGVPVARPYWRAQRAVESGFRNTFQGSAEEARQELDRRLGDAVRLRMIADVPVGAFLSGGVDSSAVVALMQKHSTQRVRTFTIGFDDAGYDEAVHARAVARHLGTEHSELYVTSRQALDVIPRLPQVYDEPFADASQIPTYLLSQFTRQHVKVALSGDGADELFGGYNRHVWLESISKRTRRVPLAFKRMAARALDSIRPARWEMIARFAGPFVRSVDQRRLGEKLKKLSLVLNAGDCEQMYSSLLAHWDHPEQIAPGWGNYRITKLTNAAEWPATGTFTRLMMFLDLVSYLPSDILVKVDRAAMAVSLETRAPFLDPDIVHFACRLPVSLNIRGSQGKRLLRQVLYQYVPANLIERPKAGFAVPLDRWLRGPLRDWAECLLDEKRLQQGGVFDFRPIRAAWREHLDGNQNRSAALWTVLMFQAWVAEQRKRRPT